MTRSAVAFAVIAFALSADAAPVPVAGPPAPPARRGAEPLPRGAVARLGSNRFRVPGGIDKIVVSPGGKFVAASGAGGITVFGAAGRPVARVTDAMFVETIAFAADDTLLALLSREDGGRLLGRYDPASGRLRAQIPYDDQLVGGAAAFSPDGEVLAVGQPDGGLKMIAVASAKELGAVKLKNDGVNTATFSPDGRWLGVSTRQNRFLVFDRLTANEVCLVKPQDAIMHFAFARDGKRVALAGNTNAVVLVDVPSGATRRVKARDAVERVEFTAAGELLTYSATTGSARVFDAAGKEVRTLRGLDSLAQLELSPDGKTLFGGTYTGTIRLWDVATGKKRPQSADPPAGITQLSFPAPGRLVGFAEDAGWLGWDVATGKQRRIGPRVKPEDTPPGLSPDASKLAKAGPKGLRILDAKTGKAIKTLPLGEDFDPTRTWFSPDGKEVFAWGTGAVRVWDLGTGKARTVEFGGKYDAVALDVSPDGTRLAAALQDAPNVGTDAVVRVFDLKTGKRQYELSLAATPSDITFTPDGSRFAVFVRPLPTVVSAINPLQIVFHDAATGRVLRRLSGDYSERPGIPFSPDGRAIAMTGSDSTVRILEVASGKDRAVYEHSPHDAPDGVAFSPDGLHLATAGGEVPVYVWDLRGRQAPAGPEPTDGVAERLWRDLGADDAAAAYAAVTTLERHPAAAVRLFRGKLRPVSPTHPESVARWVAALDAPDYRERAAAERDLTRVADRSGPALRAAAARTASAEVRDRLNRVLERSDRPTADVLRVVRAVEALEYAGTADAKALMAEWATGAAGARLTTEAAAAVKRMR